MGLIVEPEPPVRSAGRVLGRAAARLVAAGTLVVVVSRAVGGEQKTPLVEFALLVPFAAVAAVLALVLALVVRARWTAWLLAALVAVQGFWLAPSLGLVSAPDPSGPTGEVRVMTLNSLTGQADADRIVELVREQRIDLLATVEITPRQQARLERDGLADLLPHRIGRTSRQDWAADGTVLWSRWPIAATQPFPSTEYGQPRGVVRLPSGRALTVTAVHTLSPIPTRVQRWRADIRAIAEGVGQGARAGDAQLVLGDFNATRDHAGFRRVLAEGGLVDVADVRGLRGGAWPGFTWPANKNLLPPVIRLDHVLVTRGQVGVRDLQRVRVPGTDHLGLVAVLVA